MRFDDAAVTADQAVAALARLLDDDISLERAWQELNEARKRPAPQVTVEALMFSLRSGGVALARKEMRERLAHMSETQLHEVCTRLHKLTIARPWTSEETALLTELWETIRHD